MAPHLVFAGGGSGGHLYPALAVADWLEQRCEGLTVTFVGSSRAVESRIFSGSHAHRRHSVIDTATAGDLRRRPWSSLKTLWSAVRSADTLLRESEPRLVVGWGGFTSVPVLLAARRRRLPIVLAEQNVDPGRATRLGAWFADRTCVAFAETAGHLPRQSRCLHTGNPVRRSIASMASETPDLGLGERRTVAVFGGSQGATGINELIVRSIEQDPQLFEGWQVMHQTGPSDVERVRSAYASCGIPAVVAGYFDDAAALYREAGLVICRAGATTLAEIACAGLPALLVPAPQSARDHQRTNADFFVRQQAAAVCEEGGRTSRAVNDFHAVVRRLLLNEDERMSLARHISRLAIPDATDRVGRVLAELARIPIEPGAESAPSNSRD